MRVRTIFPFGIVICAALLAASCGGGGSSPPPDTISIQLGSSTLAVTQDGTPASLTVSITSSGNPSTVTFSPASLPSGVMSQIVSSGSGGTINFTASSAAAGTYPVTVNATDGVASASANFNLVVAILATVHSTVNTNAGVNGFLQEFMSTSFQPAEWDSSFFTINPGATTPLNNLNSQHIRLQPVSAGTPQKDANTWDFTVLDAILNPVISVTDKSPELQIAVAPGFMRNADGSFVDPSYQQFAQYCANLVRYYNTSTGFVDGAGKTHVHSRPVTPITWWGIFNEPNINGVKAAEYPKLYNAVVPAMQAAGSVVPLKFVAVELADFGSEPQNYLPSFVSGVTAQVDAVATHYYSSCNQSDLDTSLFGQISATFVPHVNFIYTTLRNPPANPALATVPVWVTENNVNADFGNAQGNSTCNPMQKFVTDQRGTSAFFAAWRPYVFSQLGQVGNQALYHWDFDADQQYGEEDYTTGKTYLSYWVDYELARYFPSPPGSNILTLNSTENTTVEVLATKNDDGSVVVMVANRAVHASSDDNGPGDPRTVVVDLTALGTFGSATQLTIDANTDPSKGPMAASVTPASHMTISLGGYGVTILLLK